MSRESPTMTTKKKKIEIEKERAKLIGERNALNEKIDKLTKEWNFLTKKEKRLKAKKYRRRVIRNIFNHVSAYNDEEEGDGKKKKKEKRSLKRTREEEGEELQHYHLVNDVLVVIFNVADSIWDIVAFLSVDKGYNQFMKTFQFHDNVIAPRMAYEVERLLESKKKSVFHDLASMLDEPSVLGIMNIEIINTIAYNKNYTNLRTSPEEEEDRGQPLLLKDAYILYAGVKKDDEHKVVKVTEYMKEKMKRRKFLVAHTRNKDVDLESRVHTKFMRNTRFYAPVTICAEKQNFRSLFVVGKMELIQLNTFIKRTIGTKAYLIAFIPSLKGYTPSLSSLKIIRSDPMLKRELYMASTEGGWHASQLGSHISKLYTKRMKLEPPPSPHKNILQLTLFQQYTRTASYIDSFLSEIM